MEKRTLRGPAIEPQLTHMRAMDFLQFRFDLTRRVSLLANTHQDTDATGETARDNELVEADDKIVYPIASMLYQEHLLR